MNIGKLAHRVTLQRPGGTRDAVGERVTTWTDVATVWANVTPTSTAERNIAAQAHSLVTHRITIRYQGAFTDTRVAASLRALYKNRIFNIQASLNEDEANVRIHLLASEGLNDGQ